MVPTTATLGCALMLRLDEDDDDRQALSCKRAQCGTLMIAASGTLSRASVDGDDDRHPSTRTLVEAS